MSIRYEFERKQAGSDRWDRSKFRYHPQWFGPTDPTDEKIATEMLQIQSRRYREGTTFRLIKVEETIIGDEVVSPRHDCQ